MLVRRLGGVPSIKNNKMFFESPFGFSVDHLDLALLKASNLFISESKSAYPVRIMLGNECDFFDGENKCLGGSVFQSNSDGVATMKTCPSCKGSGLKNRISPNGELLFNGKDLADQNVSSGEIMRYVSPDSDILRTYVKVLILTLRTPEYYICHTTDMANTPTVKRQLLTTENKALMALS
jgi:hypothetical protein